MAAVEMLSLAVPRLTADDLGTVEDLIRQASTWALVDGLAATVAGGIALRDASSWPRIDGWASDPDFWVRRSALLALLPGIRSGRTDMPRFTRYAEPLLADNEFFILIWTKRFSRYRTYSAVAMSACGGSLDRVRCRPDCRR